MDIDRAIRPALVASFVFNMIGASMFMFPQSLLGRLVEMPWPPAIYRALTTTFIILFGLMYLWLAFQPRISRALIGFSAISKTAVFGAIAFSTLLSGATMTGIVVGSGDLMFALIYLLWLRNSGM